jgi:hypothetical protein
VARERAAAASAQAGGGNTRVVVGHGSFAKQLRRDDPKLSRAAANAQARASSQAQRRIAMLAVQRRDSLATVRNGGVEKQSTEVARRMNVEFKGRSVKAMTTQLLPLMDATGNNRTRRVYVTDRALL